MIGRRVRLAGAALLLAFALPAAAWASGKSVHIRQVQTAAFPTVGVTVSVAGMTDPSEIRVAENGSAVRIISARPLLSSGREIDIVLAIDTSESVAGEPLAQAVEAAQRLVATVPDSVPIGVLTFSDQPRVLNPITADHGAVIKALTSIRETHSGTALYDAVGAAATMFKGAAQHNLVLLTDGRDIGSRVHLSTATAAAKQVPMTVFSVGTEGSRTNFSALQDLSSETKGTFYAVSSSSLNDLYERLGQSLSHQFLVQYHSNSARGAQVTVTVESPAGSDSSTVLLPRALSVGRAPESRWPDLSGSWVLVAVLFLTFVSVFLLTSFGFGERARKVRDRQLARRMMARAPDESTVPPRPDVGITAWIPDPLVQVGQAVAEVGGFKSSLDRKLERAGLPTTAGEVVAGSVLLGVGGAVLGALIFRNVVLALVCGGALVWLPSMLVGRVMRRRVNLLHSQLPDVLMILASSMRAGHSFLQALDTVAKEIGDPSGPEFARVVTEIRLGRPFDQALTALAERVGTDEFKWAVLGVNVQREVGGNLAEILDTLAETVREREAVRRQVKVLSAEGRMSVKILIIMPFVITLYLVLVNPSYMKLLWTTRLGIGFIATGLILMIIGTFWSRKVVRFDV